MADSAQAGTGDLDDVQKFTRVVPAGEFVFRAGDTGDELCIVQEGRIELIEAEGGHVAASVGTGGVFGEWSFFEAKPRDLSARAAVESRVIHLDRPTFERITVEAPQIASSIARQLARRIAEIRTAVATRTPPIAAPPAGEPRLVAAGGGTVFRLDGIEEALVGRPDRSSGKIPEVDLSGLDEQRTLSRRHARIFRRGDACYVREEPGVRNGTFVNGERLAGSGEVRLHDGDQVQFGLVKLEFQWR